MWKKYSVGPIDNQSSGFNLQAAKSNKAIICEVFE